MVLFDVNVLLHAFRRDAEDHVRYKSWLEQTLASDEICGVSDLVLSAVIRIATHPRIPRRPATMAEALRFVEELREHPGTVIVAPGPRHWPIFTGLCQDARVTGALVTDAYFAALAIENSAEWITTDRDYARFPGPHQR